MERVERHALAALTAGAELSVQQMLDDFDRELNADPEAATEYDALREALGV